LYPRAKAQGKFKTDARLKPKRDFVYSNYRNRRKASRHSGINPPCPTKTGTGVPVPYRIYQGRESAFHQEDWRTGRWISHKIKGQIAEYRKGKLAQQEGELAGKEKVEARALTYPTKNRYPEERNSGGENFNKLTPVVWE
jgi:hypothetical protein